MWAEFGPAIIVSVTIGCGQTLKNVLKTMLFFIFFDTSALTMDLANLPSCPKSGC